MAIVEAGYRLELDDDAWLEGVLERAVTGFDAGFGVLVLLHDHDSDAPRVTAWKCAGAVSRLDEEMAFNAWPALYEAVSAQTVATLSGSLGSGFPERLRDATGVGAALRSLGSVDCLSAAVTDPGGFGVLLAVPLPAARPPTRHERLALGRVVAHLLTALRARRRRSEADMIDALLAPDREVRHAARSAGEAHARDALRRAVLAIDRVREPRNEGGGEDALAHWQAMVEGRWLLVEQFESNGHRFLVARRNEPSATARMGLTRAETVCAIYAAMGHSQKRIAYELGVTEATVSLHVRRAVEKLGLRSRASLAHVFGAGAPFLPELLPPEKNLQVPGDGAHPRRGSVR